MRPITFTVALFGGILVSCTAFAAGEACVLIARRKSARRWRSRSSPGHLLAVHRRVNG